MGCPPGSDWSFGPQVDPRCRPFDFTLLFEDIFFVTLPAALLLILAPIQIWGLFRQRAAFSVRSRGIQRWKSMTFASILIVQILYLVYRSQYPELRTRFSLPADILSSTATVLAFFLSRASHARSLRPSTMLDLYLSLSSLLNIARTRTLWLLAVGTPVPILMTVNLSLTLFALMLESIEERKRLANGSPEEFSGIWARISFSWLFPLLKKGHAKVLSQDDLPNLDTRLQSRLLRRQLITTWSKCEASLSTRLEKNANVYHGKGLIGAWALVYLGIAVSRSLYTYEVSRFVAKLRGGLIALVYQHSLEIRVADEGDISAVTLMGTDIERIASSMQLLHETWGSLLDIAIACWLLERQLFLACLAPIALVLAWIEKVQERLRATTSLLGDIKAIKMLALPHTVSQLLINLRENEIKTSKRFRELLVATLMLSLTPLNLAPAATFAVYVVIAVYWTHESFFTAQAFTSLALIGLLTGPTITFIQTLPQVVQCVGSFDRIQQYCNYAGVDLKDENYYEPGRVDLRDESEVHLLASDGPPGPFDAPHYDTVSIHSQGLKWHRNGPLVLRDLQLDIDPETMTVITGPVGSGKSSLLNSILGELVDTSLPEGQQKAVRRYCKHVAYCSQQPWLENTTIRNNILSSSPYEKKWYDEVVTSCSLDADLKRLPRGDETNIGSKGLNLSGGQKHRIALARAIYARKPIVLLDDVFSSMDAHTIDAISSRLLSRVGLLRRQRATVILCTHHRKLMALADTIIILKNGTITAKESPATLLQSNNVNKLGLQLINNGDAAGTAEPSKMPTTEEVFDIAADVAAIISEETDDRHTDMRRKRGEMSVYAYYLSNAGWWSVAVYGVGVVGWIFCIEFSSKSPCPLSSWVGKYVLTSSIAVWMKWWSAANAAEPDKNIWMYLGVYASLGVLGTISGCICAWAPFYSKSTRDMGELLNRFSRDMELIDMELPSNMVNYTSTVVLCIAKVVILAIFTRYLGVTIPFFAIFVYLLQSFYLQTSRQIRLLAIEAHAPLFTHFSESIAGASTIRAFGWQSYHQERNYRLIDASQRPVYLQSCIQHWLGFVLEMMTAVLAVLLVSTVFVWKDKFSPGSVGVSLVTVIGFSEVLVRLVRTWTTLEPSIGAVSRVKRFTEDTEVEERDEKGAYVPATWPQSGAIEFAGWTASYNTTPSSKPVLNGITLSIKPGEHVAICGRTGSGKTSLILSILQMTQIVEGSISIDGVDLSTLSHSLVRSRINVVPQDPFLLPGTVRFNVDPLGGASDEEVVRALERVRLKAFVDEKGGIDGEVDLESWSGGQKQLLCFARAMLRRSKILILDEAMSSVDMETEEIMQQIIDTDFKDAGCTVLAVMHRLEHIRRYDKVALLGDGKLLEYGVPEGLLAGETELARLYSHYRG
ncbi:uncharacterized protein TRIREDRAFT_66111 [Trichoderma reesei QM6a]|uniref:Predicted protein n=1 Tax=Hypocrea jecorina (strain QM6a) TaxID=431241 RepID=G0RQA8_HYPJQ|nr:uncharacterized protein TRIREDRAFT_66111 [Trichoderma reesei QM6a]EGR46616.1 predicted protein [Trichoderma reesei QM6a]